MHCRAWPFDPKSGCKLHDKGWKFTMPYAEVPGHITRATMRMDCGDCDGGHAYVRTKKGFRVGHITGGNNGGPGSWQAYNSWSGGGDELWEVPSEAFPELEEGNPELQFYGDTGIGVWGTNRAILTIWYSCTWGRAHVVSGLRAALP